MSFDFGDSWIHRCTVREVDVDPEDRFGGSSTRFCRCLGLGDPRSVWNDNPRRLGSEQGAGGQFVVTGEERMPLVTVVNLRRADQLKWDSSNAAASALR